MSNPRDNQKVLFGEVPVFALIMRVRRHLVQFRLVAHRQLDSFGHFDRLRQQRRPFGNVRRLVRFLFNSSKLKFVRN